MKRLFLAVTFLFLSATVFSISVNAQDDCSAKEVKEFDFLLGNWKVKGKTGTMQITKILNGCGIQEVWQLEEFNAVLLRNYDNATRKWYLTFTAHDLVPQVWEGRAENGNWVFYRDWELNGKKRKSRTFWIKDGDRGFTKIVEQLNDDGKTWRLHDKAEFEREGTNISFNGQTDSNF